MSSNLDPLFEALPTLPPIEPDAEWELRVRARCHAAISRRPASRRQAGRRAFNEVLAAISGAAVLCAYLAVMLAEVLRLAKHS
jgi:hypothetical protein